MKKFILAVLSFTVILFFWGGITQLFPWGVPTTQKVSTQESIYEGKVDDLILLQPNSITTEGFTKQFNHKISTYVTSNTLSWIVTQPLKENYSVYFLWEVFTQLTIGILLTILLLLTDNVITSRRLGIVLIVGLLAFTGIYGQLMNWWGLPAIYAIGVGFNLIAGWLLSSFIVGKFILKPKTNEYK